VAGEAAVESALAEGANFKTVGYRHYKKKSLKGSRSPFFLLFFQYLFVLIGLCYSISVGVVGVGMESMKSKK
jgi:hypothetical protein